MGIDYPFYGYPAVYVDPKIVTFTALPAFAEVGSTVAGVSLSWSLSKTATALSLDGNDLYPAQSLATESGPFDRDQCWTLKMSDEFRSDTAKATLTFQNKLYSGFVTSAPTSSADILALPNSQFAASLDFETVIGAPPNQVFCSAYPARFGFPRKVSTTVSSGVWSPTQITAPFTDFTTSTVYFTNSSGFTESYVVITLNNPVTDPNGTVLTFS